MKKFIVLSVLLSSLLSPCEAQLKMRDVFLQIPDSLLPYLSTNSRLDFIDFIDSGMKAGVNNELGGKSEMPSLTDDGLTIQSSPATQITMHLMPVNTPVDSCHQVVCVITTVGHAAPESTIEVYTAKWRRLDVSTYLNLPGDPYVAEWMSDPQKGLVLKQMLALDPIANEEQKPFKPWLKNIEWKP